MITFRPVLTTLVAGSLLAAGGVTAALLSGGGALASSSSEHSVAAGSVAARSVATAAPAKAGPHAPGMPAPDAAAAPHPGMGMPGGGFLHGEYVMSKPGGSGTVTFLVQSGSITARTATSMTVKSTDGFTVTWAVATSTPVHRWPKGSLADLKVGDKVQLSGPKSSTGATAKSITVMPGWPARTPRPRAAAEADQRRP